MRSQFPCLPAGASGPTDTSVEPPAFGVLDRLAPREIKGDCCRLTAAFECGGDEAISLRSVGPGTGDRRPDLARDPGLPAGRTGVQYHEIRAHFVISLDRKPALDCVLQDLGLDRGLPNHELAQALSTTLVGLITPAEDVPMR